MIRSFGKADLDRVMEIWLDTNKKAHAFIPEAYWTENQPAVRQMLPQANVYVYERDEDRELLGFIGLDSEFIAGLFVWEQYQSQGIGRVLLGFAKSIRTELTLCVYRKNVRAIRFYQREGFRIRSERVDGNTGEKEYFMIWMNC